jgi:hypothetical protein
MNQDFSRPAPMEDEIRACAYALYKRGGSVPGHDVDHWLQAAAILRGQVSPSSSPATQNQDVGSPTTVELEAISRGISTLVC